MPDGDPAVRPARHRFSAEYKLAILEEYESLTDSGADGGLVSREGLYSSHIVEWRRARDTGAISGLAAKNRKKRSDVERELEKTRKKIERVEDRLDRHPKALEAQGKASGARGAAADRERGRRDEAVTVLDECFEGVDYKTGDCSRQPVTYDLIGRFGSDGGPSAL